MSFEAEWITHPGTITEDNRDYCAVAVRGREALYCVADGSTQSVESGALAEGFVQNIADHYAANAHIRSAAEISALINELSESYKCSYAAGRLSFLILMHSGGSMIAIHAGDCRLGRIGTDNQILWLTRVHTLANATGDIEEGDLYRHADRHVLTRSFRPGKSCEVETRQFSLMTKDSLVLATDGFWASLDGKQKAGFIAKSFVPSISPRDDTSCLLLSRKALDYGHIVVNENAENLYFVRG